MGASRTKDAAELPIRLFAHEHAWADWLERHHASSPGLWLRLAKKNSSIRSVSYAEALDVALCFGWIDSQKKSHDAESWIQKFTPRGKRSVWSKVNREHVARLTAEGRMQRAGLEAVARAKEDGRWDAAYDSQRTATMPDDLRAALDASPRAAAFFDTLNATNRYAVLWRVQTAVRPATRAKRIAELVAMLERGEKFHP